MKKLRSDNNRLYLQLRSERTKNCRLEEDMDILRADIEADVAAECGNVTLGSDNWIQFMNILIDNGYEVSAKKAQ